jgi:hypothetical protein
MNADKTLMEVAITNRSHHIVIRIFRVNPRPNDLLDLRYFPISLPPAFACHTTRMGLATKIEE